LTQASPKFFKELQRLFTTNDLPNPPSLIDYDQDTGLPIPRPTVDIYLLALHSVQQRSKVDHQPLLLRSQFCLESNPFYLPFEASTSHILIPLKDYPWIILTHPITKQLTIGRVFTRDPVNKVIYV